MLSGAWRCPGILFKLTIAHRFKVLSLVTYLTMGWLSLIVVYQLAIKLSVGGVTLLAVGGVVYSLGVIFYVCKRIPYNHAIWHGFVLGGSVLPLFGDLFVRGAGVARRSFLRVAADGLTRPVSGARRRPIQHHSSSE